MVDRLEINDLNIGMPITVLEWLSHKDNSWVGDILKVEAIDPPFVLVSGNHWKSVILDTRRVALGALSYEFVQRHLELEGV